MRQNDKKVNYKYIKIFLENTRMKIKLECAEKSAKTMNI